MTIDFSNGNGTIFFYRSKPSGIKPHIKLRSKYNNKLLKVNTSSPVHELLLSNFQSGTGWFSGDWTSGYNRTLDTGGYYNVEYYTDDTLRFTILAKVVNNAIDNEQTIYTTTAAQEANEQTVYFR